MDIFPGQAFSSSTVIETLLPTSPWVSPFPQPESNCLQVELGLHRGLQEAFFLSNAYLNMIQMFLNESYMNRPCTVLTQRNNLRTQDMVSERKEQPAGFAHGTNPSGLLRPYKVPPSLW